MQNNDNTRKLYDALVADNYELGDYEKFTSDISNPEYMRKLYDTMVADDYELGDYDKFSSRYSVTPQGKAAQATQATARTAQPVVDAYGMPMQPEVSTIEDAPKVPQVNMDEFTVNETYLNNVADNEGAQAPMEGVEFKENLKSDLFKPQSTETPSLLNVGAKPKDYFAEAGAKAMEGIRQERQAREYQEIMKPLSGIEGSEQKKVLEERKKQIEAQLNQPDAVRNAAARTNMAKTLENVDKELQVLNEQQKQWQEQYGSWTPSSARRFREQTMEQTWHDPYAVVPEEYKALATQKWGKEGSEDAYFSAWMNLSPEEREAFVKREHIKSFFNEETANRMQGIRERATTYAQNALSEPVVSVDPRHSASAMAARTVSNIGVQTTKALDKAEEIKQAYKNHELDENFFAGAYKGMKDGLTDIDNWTGLYMVGEMTNLYDIADKMEKGEALSQTEEDFLDAQAYKLAVEAALADDLGWGYSSGNVTGASVPFMLQMLASPIGGASGKAIDKGFAAVGRRAIDKFGKGILKKLLTKAPVKKIAKGLVGTVGKGIGQTILFGSDRVAAGTMERHLGNEMVAERANEEFNAGVQAKAGEDLGTALFKAGVSASMENISEFAGGAFIDDFTKMVGKKISKEFMDAIGGSVGRRMANAAARQNANKVFRAIANNKWGQHAVKLSKSVQSGMEWDGLLNEYLEEVLNNASNVMIGDMSMEDFTSLEKNAETLLGLAWTSGFFMANNAASRVGGYARGNIALKRTDRAARQIFTGDMQEKWDAYTQALSQADGYEEVEQLYKGLMTDISKNQDKEAAKAQMSEATAYMANYVKMMGMNAATEEADEEEQKTPAQKEMETAQGEGIAAQGTEEELDVVEEMDESYNQLAGHLGETNVEDWLFQYGETADKQLEAIRGSELDEQTKAMAEAYLTSAQRYEGLLLANQEEVDAIVEEAAKEFDANVNQELGSVIQVLTTQGKTAYVIQGNPNERENIRLRYEDGTTEPVSHVVIEKVLSQADAQTMRSDMIEGVRKSAVAEVVKRMQGVVPNATQMQMPVGHNVVVDGQAGVVAGVNADGTMQIQMQGGNVVNAAPQQVMDAQAYNTIMERKARARESARVSVPVREEVATPVAEEAAAAEAVAEEAIAAEEELTEAQKLLQEYMDESVSLEDRQAIVGNNVAQAKQAAIEAQAEVDAMTESKPKATDYTSIAEFKQAQEQWKAQMQEKQQALDLARQQEATWSEVQKGMVQPVETATEQTSAEAVPATPQVTEVQRAEAKIHNSKHDIKALAKEIGVSAKRIQRVIDFANQVGVKLNFANVTRTQGGKGAFTNADNIAKERTITLSKYQLAKGMAIEWVMGHELTHQIKADGNAANWEAYKQAIINALGQDAFDKRVKEQSKVYREAGAYQDMPANEFVETMQEEVCADAAGDMLLNPDNMNKVMGVPQSLASRIWSALKDMVTFGTPSKIKQAVDAWQMLAEGKELTGEADGRKKHSIIGTTGARALDKAEGTTVRMDNMDVAEEMEAAGKDAETIWLATGWERGADGKWKYDANDYIPEFVDNTAKKQVYEDLIDAKIKEYEAATNPTERHELRMKIGEYMDKSTELSQYYVADILGEDHPLIKAYPDLGNITIEFDPNTENCAYYPQIDRIELGTKNEDAKQNARNLAHELQHAIQHAEGFARGGNISSANVKIEEVKNILGINDKASINDIITYLEHGFETPSQNKALTDLAKKEGYDNAIDYVNSLNPIGYYNRLAGEVEARNASARQDMTPEERRQTSPSKSEDVAREEQIVLEDESGKNEMGSRVDKRMDEIAQYFNGRTLSPVQQAIVDVFGGTGNNLPISISRADGSTRRVVMRQGHENKGGSKHSTLRHFDTSSGSFTPEEILLIEDILANGTITEELRRGVAVNVYQHEINGVRYTVVTEKKDRREEFADFYTNRSGGTRSSNTQLSARAGHTTASSARKGTTSSSNTQGKGNNSTQKFSISSENEEVASLPKNEGELEKALRWVEKEEVQDWLGIADLNRPIHTINPELSSVANVLLSFQNPPILEDESSQNDANATPEEQKYSLPARPATPKRNEGESIMEYAQRVANATEAQRAWDVANKTAMDIDRQIKNSEEYRDILAQKEPQTIEEAASVALAGGKLLWNDHVDGTKVSKGAKSMMGWGEGERQRFFAMFASKENGGVSVEQMGEAVMDICSQYNIPVDETDAMAGTNAVLEVLQSAQRPSDITGYIEHNRIEQVRRMIEEEQELLAGEMNKAYMDMYGMTYDDFVEIASTIDAEDEQERSDDKNVIAWLYGQSQRQQERITNAQAELEQLKMNGVPKTQYDAAYRALEQMKAKVKRTQEMLDEATKELRTAKGQATRQRKANMRYKAKKGQWKQVFQKLREAINGKNIRSIDKNTLNEIMRAVGNADLSGMAKLFGEAGMVEDIVLGVNMRATQDRIDKLLATKTTALNDKGIATGKSVDASVQAILTNVRKTLEGILHHDIENQIHNLRSQNWHIRHNAAGNLSQEQQEQVDANKAKIEELKAELGKELATNTASTEQAVNEQIEKLTEQIDMGLRTEEESAELMTTLALKRQMVAIHTSYQDTATVEALLIRKQSELRTNWVALHDGNTPQDKREEYRQKRKALQEQIAGLEAQVREGRQATLDAMQSFADSLEETITTGRTNLKSKMQEQLQRRKEFVAKAIHDVNASGKQMQSVNEADKQENDKLPWYKRMFSPALRTFDYMLQKVATRTYGKDSWLYRQFMLGENGVMAAHDEYLRGMQTAARTLEDKAKEIFGKSYQDVMAESNRKKDIGIEILRDAEDYEPSYIPLKLTKGQATYIYMLWRMRDGFSKLATQGFTEEIMQRIEEYIGPDYIQWADWMQMEYLPMMREKYNARYREIYDTNMAAIDNYVPIRIHGQAIRKEVDLTDATASMPGMQKKNGALIQRTVNVNPIDISNNIFELIGQHIDEMEEFYAYAPVRRDLQYILSSPAFRNILNANEPGTFQSLLEAARIATKTNQQPESAALKAFNDFMNKTQKGLVSGNIAYRNMTAIKQVLSAPAFIGYSQSPEYLGILAKNMLGGYLRNLPTMAFPLIPGIGHWAQKMTVEETAKGMPYIDKFLGETFRWCMREFPDFRERVTRGSAGDIRLEEKGFSELLDKYTEIGMSANVFIDAVTVSIGLKSIYDYEMKKAEKRIQKMAKEMQMDKQWAEEEMRKASNAAKIQATLFANQTQQSSNPALLSPMQVSKNFMERSLTLYKNSSLGLMRAGIGGMRDVLRYMKGKKARRRMTEEYTRMFMQEGFAENEAKKRAISYINSEARKGAFVALLEGFAMNVIWNLGSKGLLGFMAGGGDDDNKERTTGEMVWDGTKFVINNTFGSAIPFVNDALEGRLPVIGLTTSEAEKAWKDIKKQLDENGISLAFALTGMRYAAKFGGVDMQVWANTMDGYYRLFSETGNSDDNILALMLILNSPHSNRMAVARELYKGKSKEEFQRAIELAGRYSQPVWTFGREMTDKVESDMVKWYLSDNATDEEKQRKRYIEEMKERIDNLETVEDALKMFDEVRDTELRKMISSKIDQLSKPEDTFAEKVDRRKENALAEDDTDMGGYTYMKMADSQDLLEEKRMRAEIDMLKPIVEQQKELFEEYGSKSDVYTRFMAEHGEEIRRYKTLKAYSRAIQTRKRKMDEEGADVQALYEKIKELYNDAKNM